MKTSFIIILLQRTSTLNYTHLPVKIKSCLPLSLNEKLSTFPLNS